MYEEVPGFRLGPRRKWTSAPPLAGSCPALERTGYARNSTSVPSMMNCSAWHQGLHSSTSWLDVIIILQVIRRLYEDEVGGRNGKARSAARYVYVKYPCPCTTWGVEMVRRAAQRGMCMLNIPVLAPHASHPSEQVRSGLLCTL